MSPSNLIQTLALALLGLLAGMALAGAALWPLGVRDEPVLMVAAIGALAGGYVAWRLAGLLPRAQGPASAAAPIFLLDTSAVIDGRIADVQATGILAGQLMVPDFVIAELQTLADSSDKQRRARGRRGLDLLDTLRKTGSNQLGIRHSSAADAAAGGVDAQLVAVARRLKARLVTADFNLGKVARLEGIEVVNLNDVAAALRPAMLPGESLRIQLVKPGESAGQGVGYLEDGTMVVVEGGRERLQQQVNTTVTSVLQTSSGRMIFARLAD